MVKLVAKRLSSFRLPFPTPDPRHEQLFINVHRYAAVRYGLAIVVTVIAVAVSRRLAGLYGADTLFLMLGAVILSAWIGGTGPGLLATVVSGSGAAYYLMPPLYSYAVDSTADQLRLVLFIVTSLLIISVVNSRRAALQSLHVLNGDLEQAVKDRDLLLKEVYHRVKNNLQLVSSLLSLQSEYVKQGHEPVGLFRESQSRVQCMSLVHEQLYKAASLAHISAQDYLESLAATVTASHGLALAEPPELNICAHGISWTLEQAMPCSLILHELLTNAMKYAMPYSYQGILQISIGVVEADGVYIMTVKDNGVGFPAGCDIHRSTSVGLQIVCTLTAQLRGEIALRSQNTGTVIEIVFPAVPQLASRAV